MRYNDYGINCDYARRREFHRPFWEALRALRQRSLARIVGLLRGQRLQREIC